MTGCSVRTETGPDTSPDAGAGHAGKATRSISASTGVAERGTPTERLGPVVIAGAPTRSETPTPTD